MDKKFEFVIRVDNKEVWRGMNPKDIYWKIKKKNPDKVVSVAWETKEDILVCVVL